MVHDEVQSNICVKLLKKVCFQFLSKHWQREMAMMSWSQRSRHHRHLVKSGKVILSLGLAVANDRSLAVISQIEVQQVHRRLMSGDAVLMGCQKCNTVDQRDTEQNSMVDYHCQFKPYSLRICNQWKLAGVTVTWSDRWRQQQPSSSTERHLSRNTYRPANVAWGRWQHLKHRWWNWP